MVIDIILAIFLCLLFVKLAINTYEIITNNDDINDYASLIIGILFFMLFVISIFAIIYYVIYTIWIAT
jgi:hypothetical protein